MFEDVSKAGFRPSATSCVTGLGFRVWENHVKGSLILRPSESYFNTTQKSHCRGSRILTSVGGTFQDLPCTLHWGYMNIGQKLFTSGNGRRYGGCRSLMFPSLYRVYKQSAQRQHKIEDLGCRFDLCTRSSY